MRSQHKRAASTPVRVPQGCDTKAAHHVYTDPTLLDVAGAIEALPELALDATHLPMAAGSASAEL